MWGIFTQWESERESGNREPRVWKGLLSLEWDVPHLRCLFTPLFTHCHPQLIPPGDWAACPLQGPRTHPGPYGCLIEHTTLLIELTAMSLGPFPLPLRRGTVPHPHETPVPSHRIDSRERGGWWLNIAKGEKRELKRSRKCGPFCWQTKAGNVNWGQWKVSIFAGPVSSSRHVVLYTHAHMHAHIFECLRSTKFPKIQVINLAFYFAVMIFLVPCIFFVCLSVRHRNLQEQVSCKLVER